ncbi:MAG TPA: hypothetical protein VJ983_07845, partial [candidate division Zixibacteria bacterium]|nr:hypothetical protein [candidate division Zixibacteria bacterium]
DKTFEGQFRIARIMAVAIMGLAPLVFVAFAFAVTPPSSIDPGGAKMLLYILLIVAIITPTPYKVVERSRISTYKTLGDKSKMTPGQMYLTLQIIRFALTESVFIFAAVVYFVTGRQDWFWDFYPIGIVWVVLAWPTRSKFETFMQKVAMP